ncbi:hypothetical protein [Megasphaera cerevisiae]|uniref:hypothetical protein n=1 Tax=Megasphaera cerevisiae TaxID=39029 RepID=UPI00094310D6|nr:hypothetical protein [Megasphaera cerevisiae]OKY54598.1 hypothetical protein BSR42_01935 [Megasphaera cerevisiae]
MKRTLLILVTFMLMLTAVCSAAEPRFDNMRTVLIVNTAQRDYAAQFMKKRLVQPFRIPYWNRMETSEVLSPADVTLATMRALSQTYHADIVVTPIVRTWYWNQYHLFLRGDDDEIMTDCMYNLTVYAYSRKDDTLKSYSSYGRERDSISVLNDPDTILGKAMNEIMKKLPYKRIPTDLETPGVIPSPLQVKETDGGARILINTSPAAI